MRSGDGHEPDGGRSGRPYEQTIVDELRRRASALLARRGARDAETLSLVNDVFLRVLKADRAGTLPAFEEDAELLKYLSRCARNELVHRAERRLAAKRPPEDRREEWIESRMFPASARPAEEVVEVHRALHELSEENPRMAQVVELVFFGGCTRSEVAEILGRDVQSVRTDWDFARAWLRMRLKDRDS